MVAGSAAVRKAGTTVVYLPFEMAVSPDDLSDQFFAEFQVNVEKKSLIGVIESKKTKKEVIEQVEQSRQELDELSKLEEKIGCSFFGLPNGDGGLQPVEHILNESRNDLRKREADLEELKERKTESLARLNEGNVKFDILKERLNSIQDEIKGLQDTRSNSSHSYRTLSQLMQTKFQLNKELCCISLILDDEQRVKGTIKVDKENHEDQELRNSIWTKYYNLFSM